MNMKKTVLVLGALVMLAVPVWAGNSCRDSINPISCRAVGPITMKRCVAPGPNLPGTYVQTTCTRWGYRIWAYWLSAPQDGEDTGQPCTRYDDSCPST